MTTRPTKRLLISLLCLTIICSTTHSAIAVDGIYLPIAMQPSSQARSAGQSTTLPPGDFALSFDGINDIVAIQVPDPSLNTLVTQVTFESWIHAKSLRNHERIIDRSDDDSYDRWVLALHENTRGVQININRQIAHSAAAIPLNQWIHVAATYNGETEKIYVNGNLVGTNAYSGEMDVNEAKITIGNNFENSRPFHGLITEVRIWCVARTQDQIRETMDISLTGAQEGLIAYWPMDEGQGQVVNELVSNSVGEVGLNSVPDWTDPAWVPIR